MDADAASTLARLDALERRAAEYGRFARAASGLAHVLGGSLVLVGSAIGVATPPDSPWRLAYAAAPPAWLLGQWLLRARLYQRLGAVTPRFTRGERRAHLAMTALLSVFSVAACVALAVQAPTLTPGVLLNVAFLVALPICAAAYMRSFEDYAVGFFVFVLAGYLARSATDSWPAHVFVALFAVLAIAAGVRQHLEYRRLERTLVKDAL